MTDQRYFRLVSEKKYHKGGSNTHELTGSLPRPVWCLDFGVRRVAKKPVAKGLPMSGRINYSEPILRREERELDGIGNGTSTPRQGGQPYTIYSINRPNG